MLLAPADVVLSRWSVRGVNTAPAVRCVKLSPTRVCQLERGSGGTFRLHCCWHTKSWASLVYDLMQKFATCVSVCAVSDSCCLSGDVAMVMKAESMDLRKLAEANGGGLSQNKLRKYASEMASVMRWVGKLRLESPQRVVRTLI